MRRRQLLGTLGAVGGGSIAGCVSLSKEERSSTVSREVSLSDDAIEPVAYPESPFPVSIPPAVADTHRTRVSELLESVPKDITVPNGAIAQELRSHRQQTADELNQPVAGPWPTTELETWRQRREEAATVRGAYRAATGTNDAETVTTRRETIAAEFHSFLAEHDYQAASAREALSVHNPIETLIARCRELLRPAITYPDNPLAEPFRAGDALGRIELASATLTDIRTLHDTYLLAREETYTHHAELRQMANRLRRAVHRSYDDVEAVVNAEKPPFEAELSDTPARFLFDTTRRRAESAKENVDTSVEDGRYATAIIEAAHTLGHIETLRDVYAAIQNGEYQDAVSEESLHTAVTAARDGLTSLETDGQPLRTHIAEPAFFTFNSVLDGLDSTYGGPSRHEAVFRWIATYSQFVDAVSDYLVQHTQLESTEQTVGSQ